MYLRPQGCEGIRVLEVPGWIPAIDSGGISRRNHASYFCSKVVRLVLLFPERYLQHPVFSTYFLNLAFSKRLRKGLAKEEVTVAIPGLFLALHCRLLNRHSGG